MLLYKLSVWFLKTNPEGSWISCYPCFAYEENEALRGGLAPTSVASERQGWNKVFGLLIQFSFNSAVVLTPLSHRLFVFFFLLEADYFY